MSVVALIPARAGSRRLPDKNLLPLAGRPLIAHTCAAAQASGALSAVYANTDSPEIAAVAEQHGVPCPSLRPKHLATEGSSTRDVNLFLLDFLAQRGETYDAVMVLQPTSPLRRAEDIRTALRLFEGNAPCAVVSVSPVVPECWLGRIGPDGRFERSVGNETLYRLNGAIYLYGWDDYMYDRTPRKTIAYPMPASRGVDIDTPEDLEYAEFLLQRAQPLARV